MNFQSVQKAFDEYILRFDAFPDLIFMGRGFQRDFLNENPNRNWKVLLASKSEIEEVTGCKVILVPYYDFNNRFGFFEFDDLDKHRNSEFEENIRSNEYFCIFKNLPSIYDVKPWESSPPKEPVWDNVLKVPFSVLDVFKSANISKIEIEKRKQDYSIRKGIYEPEPRF